jgi:metal-responsive CopG/Arc/MetJ family transcriptional regulator
MHKEEVAAMADLEEITVSVPKALLCEVQTLASDMDLTNSEMVELALKELVQKQQAFQDARKQIASAYADYPDEAEQTWHTAMRERQRQLLRESDEGEEC